MYLPWIFQVKTKCCKLKLAKKKTLWQCIQLFPIEWSQKLGEFTVDFRVWYVFQRRPKTLTNNLLFSLTKSHYFFRNRCNLAIRWSQMSVRTGVLKRNHQKSTRFLVGVPKIVVPQNGWFIWKTLLKWMIWGENPLFSETSLWSQPSSRCVFLFFKITI